jgi:hypothetical protein
VQWTVEPQAGGIVQFLQCNQGSAEAHAMGITERIPTMLCGWFAPAVATVLSARFSEPGVPRLTAFELDALMAELRDPLRLLPEVARCMQATRAAREAYTARFGDCAPFCDVNVDPSAGPIVTPSDECTVSGFLTQEAGPWELSHWLRSLPGDSVVARRVGIMRNRLSRFLLREVRMH